SAVRQRRARTAAGKLPRQHARRRARQARATRLGTTVRSPATQISPMAPPPYGLEPGYPPQMPTGPAFGSGGSFLGTAASTAAGVIGGALLMDGVRSMVGHHSSADSPAQSAFGRFDDNRPQAGSGSASDSNMAREAGINDIDRDAGSDRQSVADASDRQQGWDTAGDFGDDDGGFDGDDSDFA